MTHRILSAALIAGALGTAAIHPGAASEIVEIRMSGRYLAAPATMRLTVLVGPHAANRTLRVEVDGEDMFRAADVTLDGASEKRVHEIQFNAVPAGLYTLRASVHSADDVRGTAAVRVEVIGSQRARTFNRQAP